MPWWDGLAPDVLRELFDLGIDLEVAAVELVRDSGHTAALAALGAEIVPFPEVDTIGTVRQPHDPVEYVWLPPAYAEAGRSFIAAALLASVPHEPSVEPDLSGEPLLATAVLKALRLYANGATIRQVDGSTELSFRGARRVDTWDRSGAIRWNLAQRKFVVATGYKLDQHGSGATATVQLIQV